MIEINFVFFLKESENVICYTTLIFVFIASPFILNVCYPTQHVNKYLKDLGTVMVRDNFYVDNLIKTSNSPEELFYLYKKICEKNNTGAKF